MPPPTIHKCWIDGTLFPPALSGERLAGLEEQIGHSLPRQYREFLLEHNGGYPRPQEFRGGEGGTGGLVDAFLGIHGGDFDDLAWYVATYKGRIPSGCVPIAHDPFGNLICICVGGTETGRIFFWDHERELEKDAVEGRSNVRLISKDFGQFLRSFHGPKESFPVEERS